MYTVGIKRRFFFGFRKVQVDGHRYSDETGLILNLLDGSQEVYPGHAVFHFKVYNDFQTHYRELEYHAERRKAEAREKEYQADLVDKMAEDKARQILMQEREKQQEVRIIPQQLPPELSLNKAEEQASAFDREVQNEVLRRATKRVNDLLT